MESKVKIDPAVRHQMQEKGPTASIPVLIELEDQTSPAPAIDREAEMQSLQGSAEAARQGLVAQLQALGVAPDSIVSFAIVNAVATQLSPGQIVQIAGRGDVRLVRYDGPADVAI